MLSRFHMISERNGRTDGWTHRFAISISRVSMLTRDKNSIEVFKSDATDHRYDFITHSWQSDGNCFHEALHIFI